MYIEEKLVVSFEKDISQKYSKLFRALKIMKINND